MSGYNIFMIGYRAGMGVGREKTRDLSRLRTVVDHLFLQSFSLLAMHQRFNPVGFTMKEEGQKGKEHKKSYDSLTNILSSHSLGDLIEAASFCGDAESSADSIPASNRIPNDHVLKFRQLLSEGERNFRCRPKEELPGHPLLCEKNYPPEFANPQHISGEVIDRDGNLDLDRFIKSFSEQVRFVKSPLDYYARKFAVKLDSITREMLAEKPIELSFDGNYRNSHVFYRGLSLSKERSPAPIPLVFRGKKPIGFIPIHQEVLEALRALGKTNVGMSAESRVIHARLGMGENSSIQRTDNQRISCLVTIPLAWIQDEGFWHKRRVYTGNDLELNPSLGPEHIESTMQSTLEVVKRTTEVFREAIEG